jgi:hypothetical protein
MSGGTRDAWGGAQGPLGDAASVDYETGGVVDEFRGEVGHGPMQANPCCGMTDDTRA